MKRSFVVMASLAAQLGLATAAFADWPNNSGTSVPVETGPGDASPPVVVPDNEGGAIVVWSDERSGTYDLYAQRFGPSGAPLWTPNGVLLQGGPGQQTNVIGVADGAGGVMLAFSDDSYGYGDDIRVQRLNRDGTTLGAAPWAWIGTAQQLPVGMARLSNGNYCLVLSDNYWGHLNLANVILTPWGGVFPLVDVCVEAGDQIGASVVPDLAGGAYILWKDVRPGPTGHNIFAQRVDANGVPLWTVGGVQLSSGGFANNGFTGVGDGDGGLVAIWDDYDGIHSQVWAAHTVDANPPVFFGLSWLTWGSEDNTLGDARPDGEGGFFLSWVTATPPPVSRSVRVGRFTSAGVPRWPGPAFSVSGTAEQPLMTDDGDGGVFVGWKAYPWTFDAFSELYVNQVSADGDPVGSWGPTALCNATYAQTSPVMAPDGRGGAIGVWQDARQYYSGHAWDLYAGRVAPFAKLGNPEPDIVSVSDVMNDQGGRVNVRWNRSYLDRATNQQLSSYWMWREIPATAALSALAGGATRFVETKPSAGREGAAATTEEDGPATPPEGTRLIRQVSAGAWAGYWEYVGQQAAQGFANYAMTVATTGDSVPGSNPATRFMVEALGPGGHWESEPVAGYSVDNLAPRQPAPFAAVFSGASTALHWGANREADLAGYRLYRGTTSSFVPGPVSFVGAVADTQFVDAVTLPYWYKLTAVDSHGNESPVALAASSAALDVPTNGPGALSLARPSPNPARGAVSLRFTLPAAGSVRLAVLDAQGRKVRTLAEGWREAGEHTIAWDRREEGGGRAAPGIYFVRLRAAGRELTERFAALD